MTFDRHSLRSWHVTPELIWFVASGTRREDPYPKYRRLQHLDPVHHSPLGVWLLSRHADVTAALRNPSLSSDDRNLNLSTIHLGPLSRLLGSKRETHERDSFVERIRELMLFRDPPDHTRLRGLVNKAFTPRTVHQLEGRIRVIAGALLDDIAPQGATDFMASFAYPFPAQVICELIGVPAVDAHHVIAHAPALAAGLDPGPLQTNEVRAAANTAIEAVSAYLSELIARRRTDPQDDMISALLAWSDGDVLTESELISTVLLVLMAGHETTANLLGNGLVGLLAQPDRMEELRRDPTLDVAAVEELLRFDSPVQMTMRIAAEAVDVDGRQIDRGSAIILCNGAANRDPHVFEHPDAFDWHRPQNPHVAFSGGIHFCLGAPLARTEARIALRAILERMPDLRLAGTPVRRPSFAVRGLTSLPLAWSPT
jgi:cytochrome P450